MDISKLQNGDFVKYGDEIVKVIGIRLASEFNKYSRLDAIDEHNIAYSLDHYGTNEYDEISPIDITEEILKDNGFKRIDTTIGNYALSINVEKVYDKNDYSTREFLRISTYLRGGYFDGFFEIENRTKDEYACSRKTCKYVHELQQAFRLTGVDLELAIKE